MYTRKKMMSDNFVVAKTKEDVLKVLNFVLKDHQSYEDWMQFDDFELKGDLKIPRYRSPAEGQTSLSRPEYEEIYKQVCAQVL
jgi:hypothetical protein